MSETLEAVRQHAEAGRIRVSEHAMQELFDDAIELGTVIAGIGGAVVVEDYPEYVKGPCVLCLQHDEAGKPLHVLWGMATRTPDVATIVTAYRPDPERWMTDLVTRRPR